MLVAFAVFLMCVAIGAADAVLPARQYEASTLLFALPAANVTDLSGDIGAIQSLIPQIVIEAESSNVANLAQKSVPSQYQDVPVAISATGDPSSNSLTIAATSTSPRTAAATANAAAKALIAVIHQQPSSAELFSLDQFSPAPVPSVPSNPGKPVLFGATAFGAIAGVFSALGADGIRRRLRQVDEVRDRVGMPVLAEIPRMPRVGIRPSDIFLGDAAPGVLEAFQELRSSLLLMFPGMHAIFAVASCEAGEGKSAVAVNLAWALASESRPVVAVDCDLRKPTLNALLGVPIGPGVSNCASTEVAELIAPTRNPHLGAIPAGVPDRHPADIATSDVPKLLASLRQQGNTVIVDCPPLSGVAETTTLAVNADAVILVVDAQRFDPDRLQRNLARLDAAGAKVAGVVLNRVRRGTRTRYGYYSAHPGENGSTPTAKQIRTARNG